MRFDSSPYYHVGERYPWEKLVDEMHEEVRFLDDSGFTTVWLAEHHFWHDGWYTSAPNPVLIDADFAARTKRLRVGQCGVVLPDWHPIRVAEDVALLDQLTKGRVDFGVARGINGRVAIQFNVDADRRNQKRNYALFKESLDIIRKAWTEEVFSYKGEFYQFPVPGWKDTNRFFSSKDPQYYGPDGELIAMSVMPKPYQKPYPPITQMADATYSYEFAAEEGIGVMCWGRGFEGIREAWTAYRDVASRVQGRDVSMGENLSVMRTTYVAPTMEEAERDVRDGVDFLFTWASGLSDVWAARKGFLAAGQELTEEDANADWFDFLQRHDIIWVGSPEYVAEKIAKFQSELSCEHVVLFLNCLGLTFEQVMRGLDLFAGKVMPRFETAAVA